MLQIRKQAELVRNKVNVALALFAAERLLDRHIEQQAVDRRQHRAHAEVVLDENEPAALLPHCLADRERTVLLEVAEEYLARGLLQLRDNALSLGRTVVEDIAYHRLELVVLLEHIAYLARRRAVKKLLQLEVGRLEFLFVAHEMTQHRRENILGGVREKRLVGLFDLVLEK